MPRIRCRYLDCVFLDDGSFKRTSDLEEDWDPEAEEIEEWEGMEIEDDDDLWLEDDDF